MSQLVWWFLAVHLGVAGSMATVGCLNWQWWSQDRSEQLLGRTAVLCWSLTLALMVAATGLAFPIRPVWQVVLPVRAIFIGIVVAVFLKTLSALVRLPGIRTAVIASFLLPVTFVGLGVTGSRVYTFAANSPWPHFEPLGNLLVAGSVATFFGYAIKAVLLLTGDRRRQLALTMIAVDGLLVLELVSEPGFFREAMATLWSVPVAILLAWWCSARVLSLQGSLVSAQAGMRQAERTVQYLARHDELTGLPNRVAATETLHAMLENGDPATQVVVCQVQVNRLEQIRAAYGLVAGETVLSGIADYLVSASPPGGSVARIGDTSFLTMTRWATHLPMCQLEAEWAHALTQLRRSVVLPTELSVVVGIAVAAGSTTAQHLEQQARVAVAAADEAGRTVQLFRPDLQDGIVRRARTARLLTAALDRDEFEVHYQPVVDPASMARVGVEALVRWRHHGRLHPPAEWIPIAEEQGHMPSIGLAVLRIAVRDHVLLQCPVAVNVSPQQLSDPGFVASVLANLGDCPPGALTLEVTESCVMADLDQARVRLEMLRSHGIRIALDDFGTQYSSLSRLASMPLDIIKIDRSFVLRVLSPDGRALVTAIHAMAGALGKTTVAEGVETNEQLRVLTEIGCDRVQGFLTGRPARLADLLESRDRPRRTDFEPSPDDSRSVRLVHRHLPDQGHGVAREPRQATRSSAS